MRIHKPPLVAEHQFHLFGVQQFALAVHRHSLDFAHVRVAVLVAHCNLGRLHRRLVLMRQHHVAATEALHPRVFTHSLDAIGAYETVVHRAANQLANIVGQARDAQDGVVRVPRRRHCNQHGVLCEKRKRPRSPCFRLYELGLVDKTHLSFQTTGFLYVYIYIISVCWTKDGWKGSARRRRWTRALVLESRRKE